MRFLVIYFTVGDKKFIELVFTEIYIIIFEIVVLYSVKDKKVVTAMMASRLHCCVLLRCVIGHIGHVHDRFFPFWQDSLL